MALAAVAATAPAQLGRPVGANGEETRRRIVTAAMRCVAEIGYSQASIREIAKAAGMTSGSLYHYFPNKADLLQATVAAIADIALPRLRSAGNGGGDVVDRLGALLDESDRLMREFPYLAAFERAIRAESAAFLRGSHADGVEFEALHAIIAEIIEDAQHQGSLGGGVEAQGAVSAIYALARGLTEQAAVLPPQRYHRALQSAKQLIRGTLFERPPACPTSKHR